MLRLGSFRPGRTMQHRSEEAQPLVNSLQATTRLVARGVNHRRMYGAYNRSIFKICPSQYGGHRCEGSLEIRDAV